jgi:hypothetical protein
MSLTNNESLNRPKSTYGIAAVTEKDAHKELKDFRAGKRPDIAEKLHAMGFCSEEDLAAYKASSPAKRKKLLKIELPPMGPEDPF